MHLYRRMKEAIYYFHQSFLKEKKAKELVEQELSNNKVKLDKLILENKQLQECLSSLATRYEPVNKNIDKYENENQITKEQVYSLQEQNNQLLYLNQGYVKKVSDQQKELLRLRVFTNYQSSSKYDMEYEHRKYLITTLEKVGLLIKKLLIMRNQKVRRIKVIYEVKEYLAKYESCFYRNNFKLDLDAKNILEKLNLYLVKWQNFYEGYVWNAKAITIKDIKFIEDLLQELHYLSFYKRFEKYNGKIVDVWTLFQVLKSKRKIQRNYSFKKFHNELKVMAKQNYANFEKFIINRIFPGEIYAVLKSFNQIEYNFKMIKTYGMYHLLYVYGNIESSTIKVGVTKRSLGNRYMKAEESYKEYFPTHMLHEIRIINSLNALNLESYLKRKFRKRRHPLFNSTEWFLLTKSELEYFLNDEYKQDADFMKILNYKLDV